MNTVKISSLVLSQLCTIINIHLVEDAATWRQADGSYEPVLEASDLHDGQLAVAVDRELGRTLIIGRFNDELQCLFEDDRVDGLHTFRFAGSEAFEDFIESNGYIQSIKTMRLYFGMFEKSEELIDLFNGLSYLAYEDEVLVITREEDIEQVIERGLQFCLLENLREVQVNNEKTEELRQDKIETVSNIEVDPATANQTKLDSVFDMVRDRRKNRRKETLRTGAKVLGIGALAGAIGYGLYRLTQR